jgi:cytochrome c biogenesis protein CcmG, thiol:disulfide interchange protein DsbE
MWATWCPPCLAELPHFATAAAKYQGKVDFIGLAAESPPKDAEALVKRFGLPYPNVLIDGATQTRWNARALPSTYLVDKDGVVRWSVQGAIDGDLLADKIEEALGVPPP